MRKETDILNPMDTGMNYGHGHHHDHNHDHNHSHNHSHNHGHNHEHDHEHHHDHGNFDERIPINIIAGFLGAGKTTFVENLLTKGSEPVDVLVREFGQLSIDDLLLSAPRERVHTFPGISMHYDRQMMLYGYMNDLEHHAGHHIHRLLIETSGMDEPEHMLKLFMLGNMKEKVRLDSYVTIADAAFLDISLSELPLVAEQIAYSDIIVLNKADMVSEEELGKCLDRLRGINGMAEIHITTYGDLDPAYISNRNQDKWASNIREFEKGTEMDNIRTVALKEKRPMDKEKLNMWLKSVSEDKSVRLLRSKGMFHLDDSDYKYEFQGVRTSFHSKTERRWKPDEERENTIVFIGEDLKEDLLKAGFEACVCDKH